MKKVLVYKIYMVLIMAFFAFPGILMAQDSSVTTTTTSATSTLQENTWYTQPWVWIVGGAVFLLLLIALMRGNSGGRTDKVTVTKTVKTDTDV